MRRTVGRSVDEVGFGMGGHSGDWDVLEVAFDTRATVAGSIAEYDSQYIVMADRQPATGARHVHHVRRDRRPALGTAPRPPG